MIAVVDELRAVLAIVAVSFAAACGAGAPRELASHDRCPRAPPRSRQSDELVDRAQLAVCRGDAQAARALFDRAAAALEQETGEPPRIEPPDFDGAVGEAPVWDGDAYALRYPGRASVFVGAEEVLRLVGPFDRTLHVAFDASAELVVSCRTEDASACAVRAWDRRSGRVRYTLPIAGPLHHVIDGSPGRLALLGPNAIEVVGTASGVRMATLPVPAGVCDTCARLALSPDGDRLAAAYPGGLELWEVSSGRKLESLGVPAAAEEGSNEHDVTAFFDRQGRKLYYRSAPDKEELQVWDLAARREMPPVPTPGVSDAKLAGFAGASPLILAQGALLRVRADSGAVESRVVVGSAVAEIAVQADADRVLVARREPLGPIEVLDGASARVLGTLTFAEAPGSAPASGIALHASGTGVVAAPGVVWSPWRARATGQRLGLPSVSPSVRALALGDEVLVVAGESTVSAWDLGAGKHLSRWSARDTTALALDAAGESCAVASPAAVSIRDLASGGEIGRLAEGGASVGPMAWSPDGTLAVAFDRVILRWSRKGSSAKAKRLELPAAPFALAFSPDGTRLLSDAGAIDLATGAVGAPSDKLPDRLVRRSAEWNGGRLARWDLCADAAAAAAVTAFTPPLLDLAERASGERLLRSALSPDCRTVAALPSAGDARDDWSVLWRMPEGVPIARFAVTAAGDALFLQEAGAGSDGVVPRERVAILGPRARALPTCRAGARVVPADVCGRLVVRPRELGIFAHRPR